MSSKGENEENITYEITLRGLDGTYYVGVGAADTLENTADTFFDEIALKHKDAALQITEFSVSPEKAYDKTIVYVSFNVPVYALLQNMITQTAAEGYTAVETNLENVRKYSNIYSIDYCFGITKNGKYILYIADEFGRTSTLEVNVTDSDVAFGEGLDIIVTTVEYTDRISSGWSDIIVYSTRIAADDELVMPGDRNQQIYTAIEVSAPDGFTVSPAGER